MPTTDRPLSPKQVADLFGVSPEAVRAWADSGKLPYFRTPGGQRRFRLADLNAFLEGEAAVDGQAAS